MSQFGYYNDLDSHPFVGERKVSFKAKISEKPFLDGFFNGSPKHSKVENVTRGKAYDIYKVMGQGDGVDFYFLDDTGKEMILGDFFFEAAEE